MNVAVANNANLVGITGIARDKRGQVYFPAPSLQTPLRRGLYFLEKENPPAMHNMGVHAPVIYSPRAQEKRTELLRSFSDLPD